MRKAKQITALLLVLLLMFSCLITTSAAEIGTETDGTGPSEKVTAAETIAEEPSETSEVIPTETTETEEPKTYEVTTVPIEKETQSDKTELSEPATKKPKTKSYVKKKDLNNTGANLAIASTGATTAAAKDIYLADGTAVSNASVTIDTTQVVITAGAIICTWNSTSSDNSTGTLTISRTNTGTMPEYLLGSRSDANGTTRNKSWAPWNGMAKWGSYTTYHAYLPASKITKIVFDSKMTSVATNACRGCTDLTSVEFGTSFKVIGQNAFANNASLESLVFKSNTITSIGAGAFQNCTSLVSSKVGTPSDSVFYGLKTAINAENATGDKLNVNTNVFTLPSTITTIGEKAFWCCYSLRAVTWTQYNTSISHIKYATFGNCVSLQMFIVPSSLIKIWGMERNSDNYGSFIIGDSSFTGNNPIIDQYTKHNLYVGIENTAANTKLTTIGDGAFERTQEVTSGSTKYGVKFAKIDISNTSNSSIIGTNDVMIMPKVNYIGNKAFRNCSALTGIIQFDSNVNLGSRAFVNTNLTDIYFKWSGESANSSTIGTSNQFISASDSKGYTDSGHTPPSGYYSLRTVLDSPDNSAQNLATAGLKARWARVFKNIDDPLGIYSGSGAWSLFVGESLFAGDTNESCYSTTSTTLPLYATPYASYGDKNNTERYDDVTKTNSVSYLKTNVNWSDESKAEETVTFGYKMKHGIDFVFVVDNSPSMDVATRRNLSNGDTTEKAEAFTGTNNVSKMLTAYSQISAFSKKILEKNSDNNISNSEKNSVTIVSFWGDESNSLSGSAKNLGDICMTNVNSVNTALFGTDNHHEEGVSTNFSSGLGLAYQNLISNNMRNGKNKIVILLSDGDPTVAKDGDGTYTNNAHGFAAHQINGVDWAAAIRDDTNIDSKLSSDGANETGITIYNSSTDKYQVHNFTTSNYVIGGSSSQTYQTVDGLGYPLYSITIGEDTVTDAYKRVTNGSSTISNNTYASSDASDVANKLVDIANGVLSQNIKLVVPLDNNFILDTNVTQELCIDNVVLTTTLDKSMHDLFPSESSTEKLQLSTQISLCDLNSGSDVSLEGTILSNYIQYYYNLGFIKYDKNTNCLILTLDRSALGKTTDRTTDNIISENGSHPYWTYELSVPLKYVGGGVKVNPSSYSYTHNGSTQNIRQMVAVNNAHSGNLVNNYNSSTMNYYQSSRFTGTISTTSLGNYNMSTNTKISNLGGAYLATYSDNWEQFSIANVSDPIYLPLQEIKTAKYKKNTSTVLNGAEFEIYTDRAADGTIEQVKFTTNGTSGSIPKYNYSVNGSVTKIPGNAIVSLLPGGTYYFAEVTAPNEETDYKYNKGTDIIGSKDGVSYVYKLVIDDINPVYTTSSGSSTQYEEVSIYNTPIAKGSTTVVGQKVDPANNPVPGAGIALYANSTDRENDTNRLAYTTSDNNGNFSFQITSSMGTGTYYWKEVDVPAGYATLSYYEETRSAKYFRVNTISEGTTVDIISGGKIYNSPTTNIYVHVNSSDAVKNGFNFTLTSNATIAPNGNVTTITGTTLYGTSDSNGMYVFENVPVYTATFNYGQFWFGKFTYNLQETGLPSHYITPEYGTSFESTTARTGVYTIGTLTEGEIKSAYVFNPSIKVTLHNYDSDGLTPLCSLLDFNGTTVTTDNSKDTTYWTGISSTGSVNIDGWFGYTSDIPLIQTKVQDGYSLLADSESITLNSSSTYTTAYTPTGLKYYKYDYTILNSQKTGLPNAGGNGNLLLYILLTLTACLTVTAIVTKAVKKKKQYAR